VRMRTLALSGVLFAGAGVLTAQELQSSPPPVLLITHEEIKPGSMGTHERSVASYFALWERAKVPGNYRLGLVPVSGDQNEVLYLQGYPSFAAMEADQKAMESAIAASAAYQTELDQLERSTGPLHATQSTAVAVYRADLSYRPLKMEDVAKSRYFSIAKIKTNMGQSSSYEDYTKQFNQAREKANLDEHTAVFQVISGSAVGTFLSFSAFKSLTEWDTFRTGMEARNKAIDEALGGEMVVKQRQQLAGQIYAGVTSALYAFNPKISRPAPAFAAVDVAFWAPQAAGKMQAAKKEEKKP